MRADRIQEKTSGSEPEPSSPPAQSRLSSAEPPKHVELPPVVSSPPITQSAKADAPCVPAVPIIAALPTITLVPLPIADPSLGDGANLKSQLGALSSVECECPSIWGSISTETTGTWAQDHTLTQELLSLPENDSVDEVVDLVGRQSALPSALAGSPLSSTLLQREEVLDAVVMIESLAVAPPQLAAPGEVRLSDDWAASVLKAATTPP